MRTYKQKNPNGWAYKTIALTSVIAIVITAFWTYSALLQSYSLRIGKTVCAATVIEVEKEWTTAEIEAEIRKQAALYDLNPDLMAHIAKCESGFSPYASNTQSTATGIFQILNGTWKEFKCKGGISNVEDNIKCAMKIASLDSVDRWEWCSTH